MTAHNINRHNIMLSTVVRTRAFQAGYADKLAGRPPRDDVDQIRIGTPIQQRREPVNMQWYYERGRLVAAAGYRGPIMSGRYVSPRFTRWLNTGNNLRDTLAI